MNRVDFEQTTLFYFLKEHYYELGGLTPMMDQIPDIDFDFLIQWFLDQFNNRIGFIAKYSQAGDKIWAKTARSNQPSGQDTYCDFTCSFTSIRRKKTTRAS